MYFLKKHAKIFVSSVTLTIAVVLGVSHTAFATDWSEFQLASTTGKVSGWCMDNTAGSSTNGNPQQLWKCSESTHSGYGQVYSGYDGGDWQELQIQGTGKCLSGQGGGNGTRVVEYQCNNSANQAVCWIVNNYGVTTWMFSDGEAIDDENDTGANGNPITVWALNASNSESWFGPSDGVPSTDSCAELVPTL